jgi:heptosyltransferase II
MLKPLQKIVVFVPRFIGDMVNTSSALQILVKHHPEAAIYLVARPLLEPMCERLGGFRYLADLRQGNKVAGTLDLIRRIKAEKFDLAILLTNTFADACIAFLAGVPRRVGYQSEGRSFLLTHSLKRNPNRHYINRYAYVTNLACANQERRLLPPVLKTYPYRLPQSTQQITLALYFGCELKAPRYYPMAPTLELLKRLHQRYSLRFVIIGAEFESAAAADLMAGLPGVECVNLCGKTRLDEMVDVIAACDGLITIDSSPLHIGAALNKPLVVLESQGFSPFSAIQPKNPDSWVASSRWGFLNDDDQVLDLPVEHIEEAVAKMVQAIEQRQDQG